MAGRTAREILADRERELASELGSLIEYKISLETELEDVRTAMDALKHRQLTTDKFEISDHITAVVIPSPERLIKQHRHMTINELVLDALFVHFLTGASHAMLREAFQDKYGREIEQSSLRSQLARLKALGLVKEAAEPGYFELTPRGAAQTQNERRQRMLRSQQRP